MTATRVPEGGTLYSPANGRRIEHWVWVPDGTGPFPLLVLLHGVYDAGGFVWWQQGKAHETAAALIDSGETEPFVLLMAGDTGAAQGSGYCDWMDGTTHAETYVIRELLPWAEANLPVKGMPRWITGLSMGGYGALLLALRHPGLFASSSALSGFFDPMRMFDFVERADERMWGNESGRSAHDVRELVAAVERRVALPLAFDCGVDDPLIAESRALHEQLERLGVDHGYAEHAGGHTWDYWRDHLADHVRFHQARPGPLGTTASLASHAQERTG